MSQRLVISTPTELVAVHPEDILYFEASGTYTILHLIDKSTFTFSSNLATMQDSINKQFGGATAPAPKPEDPAKAPRSLPQGDEPQLIRVGRSLIVNKEYIYHIQPTKQVLELAVPRLSLKATLSASKEVLKILKEILENEKS